jgi:hypothetical protein
MIKKIKNYRYNFSVSTSRIQKSLTMKSFLHYKVFFLILFITGFLIPYTSNAQNNKVYAYEGFDYFNSVVQRGPGFVAATTTDPADTVGVDRSTIIPSRIGGLIALNRINSTVPRKNNTNSAVSLGWSSDWILDPSASVVGASNDYHVVGTDASFEITSADGTSSIINSGSILNGGRVDGKTIGRRLQTSTGGPFFEYNFTGTPFPPTPFGGPYHPNTSEVQTIAPPASNSSTLRSNGGSSAQVNHPSATFNTAIGAQGTSIFVAVMMRKNLNNDNPCFITLHHNGTAADQKYWDNSGTDNISIGYFGTASNSAGNRYWGVRIGQTNVFTNFANSNTQIATNNFSLLVIRIDYNYTTGHTINMYVINNGAVGLNSYPTAPATDLTITPAQMNLIGNPPIYFHSLAYFGGNLPSDSSIDEIRFGRFFETAALASQTISVIRGLCSGLNGFNIFDRGSFGTIASLNPNGSDGTLAANEEKGSNSPYDDDVDSQGIPNRFPYFKQSGATLGTPPVAYSTIASSYLFTSNQSNQPNDGAVSYISQTRPPFGGAPFATTWIKSYDNGGYRNGVMMVVNAAYAKGIFYEQDITGICGGTQYEFYIDVLNLFKQGIATVTNPLGTQLSFGQIACDTLQEPGCSQFSFPGTDQSNESGIGGATNVINAACSGCPQLSLNPEIEFLIDGRVVYIPPISIPNDERWHRVGFTFVTKNIIGPVKFSVRNRAPGGIGNDLALDNITFRPCGPIGTNDPDELNCPLATPKLQILLSGAGEGYSPPVTQWQRIRGGVVTNIGTPVTSDPPEFDYALFSSSLLNGDLVRAIIAGSASELAKSDSKCRILSIPVLVNCTTLPVSFVFFKGNATDKNIQLDWQVAFEKNADFYEVQRSQDGTNFVSIGKVKAIGFDGKDLATDYIFFDNLPLSGVNYYRLKLVDVDKSYQYSKVVSVNMTGSYVWAYPNPADQQLHIVIGSDNGEEEVKIKWINNLGVNIKEFKQIIHANVRDYSLDTHSIPPGIYMVEIYMQNRRYTYKISITH